MKQASSLNLRMSHFWIVKNIRLLGITKVQEPTIEKVSDELMSAYEIGINESI